MIEWRDIPEYEGHYQVNNVGEVRSLKHNKSRILKQHNDYHGYSFVGLVKDKVQKNLKVHKLVSKTFLNDFWDGKVVNHIDGNKLNNNLSNLELITQSENIRHAMNIGLINIYGEDNNNCKLTSNNVAQIRDEYRQGNISQRAIAKKYNVCQATITKIVNNRTWVNCP